MNKWFFIIGCTFFSGLLHAQELVTQINLNLQHKEGVWVIVEITNSSSKTVECLNGSLVGLLGEISSPVFKVNYRNIEKKYVGFFDLYRPGDIPVIRILPGRSLTTSVEISYMYDFSEPGKYEIQFDSESIGFCGSKPHVHRLKSNILRFEKIGNTLKVIDYKDK